MGDGLAVQRNKGRIAEDLAAVFLESEGFNIIGRNSRLADGELDIIAMEGDILAFVEVKAGLKRSREDCLASVDSRKISRLVNAAAAFMAKHNMDCNCRFDVVTVDLAAKPPACRLLRDAFRPES